MCSVEMEMYKKKNEAGREVDVSIFVTTYNSEWKKLRYTLDSVLAQRNITYEIIISDDGSRENNSTEIREYFRENSFSQYTLLENTDNVGTVRNCLRAVEPAKGRYIKGIGPGDCLIGRNCLADWVKVLRESGKKWAFGDYLYYRRIGVDEIQIETHALFPKNIEPYLANDEAKIRYISVMEEERPSGVATIFEKNTWKRYLEKVAGFAKYAEDLSYYLMFLEDDIPFYFRRNVVAYEIGEGVSTSRSEFWLKIMEQEKRAVNEYISGTEAYHDLLQQKEKYQKKENERWHRRSSLYCAESELTAAMYKECCIPYISEIQRLSAGRKVWIYGAGFCGKILEQILQEHEIAIEGYIDQNHQKLQSTEKLKVIGMGDIDCSEDFIVVALMEIVPELVELIHKMEMDRHYIYIPATRKMKVAELMDMCVDGRNRQ